MTFKPIEPGRLYDFSTGEEATDGVPAVVACRRLEDFPPEMIETVIKGFGKCTGCGAGIAFDPNGRFQDAPKMCFQCLGILPLQITGGAATPDPR